MKTPVEICNDALRILGLRTDCTNIHRPITESDKVFCAYFDQIRRKTIKQTKPRFACVEQFVLTSSPVSPMDIDNHEIKFLKPHDCLYVQKVNGGIDFTEYGNTIKPRNIFKFGQITINYVKDITDTGLWTDEFDELMAANLAKKVAAYLTKDTNAIKVASEEARIQTLNFNSLNAKDAKIKKKNHYLQKRMWPFPNRY